MLLSPVLSVPSSFATIVVYDSNQMKIVEADSPAAVVGTMAAIESRRTAAAVAADIAVRE